MSKLYHDTDYPEMVYLRAHSKTRPVRTIESIEQSGLILDQAHAIAMFTSRSVPNVGPRGPAGHGFDTIIASASDEFTPISLGGPKTTFRCPYPLDMTNGYVRASLTTAPDGADMIIDVLMNGVTMFTTPMRIEDGSKTTVGAAIQSVLNLASIPDDAEFLVYVTQAGSTFAGAGLKVAVTGEKVDA